MTTFLSISGIIIGVLFVHSLFLWAVNSIDIREDENEAEDEHQNEKFI